MLGLLLHEAGSVSCHNSPLSTWIMYRRVCPTVSTLHMCAHYTYAWYTAKASENGEHCNALKSLMLMLVIL